MVGEVAVEAPVRLPTIAEVWSAEEKEEMSRTDSTTAEAATDTAPDDESDSFGDYEDVLSLCSGDEEFAEDAEDELEAKAYVKMAIDLAKSAVYKGVRQAEQEQQEEIPAKQERTEKDGYIFGYVSNLLDSAVTFAVGRTKDQAHQTWQDADGAEAVVEEPQAQEASSESQQTKQEALRERVLRTLLKGASSGQLSEALEASRTEAPQDSRLESLKEKACLALEQALEDSPGEQFDEQPADLEEFELEAAKEKARRALEDAFGVAPSSLEDSDEEELKEKARQALEGAFEASDEEELKAKAQEALEAALEASDEEALKEKAQEALEAALEASDEEALKEKAQEALEAALEDSQEEELKEKAQEALEAALEDSEEEELKEKAQEALEAALEASYLEGLKEKACEALEEVARQREEAAGLETPAAVQVGGIELLRQKAKDVLTQAAVDHSLEGALTSIRHEVTPLRVQGGAGWDGMLDAAKKAHSIQNLRLKAQHTLLEAADTGRLHQVLAENLRNKAPAAPKAEEAAAEAPNEEKDVMWLEDMRARLRATFIKAAQTGTFKEALNGVKAKQAATEAANAAATATPPEASNAFGRKLYPMSVPPVPAEPFPADCLPQQPALAAPPPAAPVNWSLLATAADGEDDTREKPRDQMLDKELVSPQASSAARTPTKTKRRIIGAVVRGPAKEQRDDPLGFESFPTASNAPKILLEHPRLSAKEFAPPASPTRPSSKSGSRHRSASATALALDLGGGSKQRFGAFNGTGSLSTTSLRSPSMALQAPMFHVDRNSGVATWESPKRAHPLAAKGSKSAPFLPSISATTRRGCMVTVG